MADNAVKKKRGRPPGVTNKPKPKEHSDGIILGKRKRRLISKEKDTQVIRKQIQTAPQKTISDSTTTLPISTVVTSVSTKRKMVKQKNKPRSIVASSHPTLNILVNTALAPIPIKLISIPSHELSVPKTDIITLPKAVQSVQDETTGPPAPKKHGEIVKNHAANETVEQPWDRVLNERNRLMRERSIGSIPKTFDQAWIWLMKSRRNILVRLNQDDPIASQLYDQKIYTKHTKDKIIQRWISQRLKCEKNSTDFIRMVQLAWTRNHNEYIVSSKWITANGSCWRCSLCNCGSGGYYFYKHVMGLQHKQNEAQLQKKSMSSSSSQ